jgi:NADPH-dependent 2,4-dienoyl-CoA reductase/sulfur reductase-like enzyme/nitrite reductase/ring-hydroxylating ferredoxin subunit
VTEFDGLSQVVARKLPAAWGTERHQENGMSTAQSEVTGPDLQQGVAINSLADGGLLAGHVGDDAVVLARRGGEFFAIGATCTHYGGPLAEGLIVDDTVRCPWHHACFSLRTGEALHAPALGPIACWATELRGGKVFVREKTAPQAKLRIAPRPDSPQKIVIVGGGAAGFAAAEMLRRQKYQGSIVMLSDDDAPPVDRPNLSKDYLAGNAPEEWVPLRGDDFYAEQRIDLRLKISVAGIDVQAREVALGDGGKLAYDHLLLATGAEPIRLPLPGADLPHVRTLRTLADCRAIIALAATAQRAVVMGASFIGLEAAAALRARGVEVHVVAPEKRPMERVLGAQMGDFVRDLHQEHGVIFHLEDTAVSIDARKVNLKSGGSIEADLVVVGVGVRPRLALAERAGLLIDRGVTVNEYLETSAPCVYAAGDIARWPDPHSGAAIRVEHWVVAQRQGQTAALNMLGGRQKFDAVPYFWSQHYDVPINYIGHAESWDEIAIDGDIAARDCVLRYRSNGRVLAVASIYRDADSLKAEASMDQHLRLTTRTS